MDAEIDILEDAIEARWPGVLAELLVDHTRRQHPEKFPLPNIVWATDSYSSRGEEYAPAEPIRVGLVTKENGRLIQPRVSKSHDEQVLRTKDKAEVFTPSWVCNAQNNLVDNAWFGPGLENQFNTENPDHTWTVNHRKVEFPEGKTWQDYVRMRRMEITCGEAPYLCSRYDTVSGEPIPTAERIGLLDRKLRVASENTETSGEWLEWAKTALKSTYAFEFQGDSLLIARENVLITLADFYEDKFCSPLPQRSVAGAAYIVSWNLWQMDGLNFSVPYAQSAKPRQLSIFADDEPEKQYDKVYCIVRDWSRPREKQKVEFRNIMPRKKK